MTQFRLRDDLSCCMVNDHLIFLDIRNDRYFRLAKCLETSLVTYLDGSDCPESSIRRLIERKILVDGPDDIGHASHLCPETASRSAMEETGHTIRPTPAELMETLVIVCFTQLQLKTRGLKHVLDKLSSRRGKRSSRASTFRRDESQAMDAAATFRSARLYVPIDTCCLLDSIAMITFLTKRDLHADLVFGVTGTPFSAHCWAQHGTTVLNDALGHTLAFTPIRVI